MKRLLVLGALMIVACGGKVSPAPAAQPPAATLDAPDPSTVTYTTLRDWAIEVGKLVKTAGYVPEALEEVPEDGWGRPIRYHRVNDTRFSVCSDGPDGIPGNYDDKCQGEDHPEANPMKDPVWTPERRETLCKRVHDLWNTAETQMPENFRASLPAVEREGFDLVCVKPWLPALLKEVRGADESTAPLRWGFLSDLTGDPQHRKNYERAVARKQATEDRLAREEQRRADREAAQEEKQTKARKQMADGLEVLLEASGFGGAYVSTEGSASDIILIEDPTFDNDDVALLVVAMGRSGVLKALNKAGFEKIRLSDRNGKGWSLPTRK